MFLNLKRTFTIGALLFSSGFVLAEESQWKYKIHKNFIKDILHKNYKIAFDHIGEKIEK